MAGGTVWEAWLHLDTGLFESGKIGRAAGLLLVPAFATMIPTSVTVQHTDPGKHWHIVPQVAGTCRCHHVCRPARDRPFQINELDRRPSLWWQYHRDGAGPFKASFLKHITVCRCRGFMPPVTGPDLITSSSTSRPEAETGLVIRPWSCTARAGMMAAIFITVIPVLILCYMMSQKCAQGADLRVR